MYLVNAVDSFCDMKLAGNTGNGEKKLYLSKTDSIDFATRYLGISIDKGMDFYTYNSEVRARTRGLEGFVTKNNLTDVFNRSAREYTLVNKYRTNLDKLREENQQFLDEMRDRAYFTINCSISEDRIYIGSTDTNWFAIPSFCIPQNSEVKITNRNASNELKFEIFY